MSLFISDAMASTSAAAPQDGGAFSLVMIGVIFVLFYFMLIRPQNKRAKEHKDMVTSIKKGDEVVTSGGIIGRVSEMNDNYLKLLICDSVEITLQKGSISSVLPKNSIKSMF